VREEGHANLSQDIVRFPASTKERQGGTRSWGAAARGAATELRTELEKVVVELVYRKSSWELGDLVGT